MAIIVACPGCSTKLSAPESAAGKMIRCPKCGATPTVPELLVEAAFAPPPPPAPRPKPAPRRDEDEERPRSKARREDDEEDRPRKKRKRYADDDDDDYGPPRRRRKKSGSGGKIALIVLGSLLLLAGVGVGIYYLVGKGGLFTKKAPVPAGWQQYIYPDDGFKAYFPEEPVVLSNNANPLRGGGGGVGMGFPGMAELGQMDSVSTYICGDKFGLLGPGERSNGKVNIVISIAQFRNGVPRSLRDQLRMISSTKVGNMETRRVSWLGHDAAELVMGGSLHRIVYTDKAMINVEISGTNGGRATPEEENGFFENFELIK